MRLRINKILTKSNTLNPLLLISITGDSSYFTDDNIKQICYTSKTYIHNCLMKHVGHILQRIASFSWHAQKTNYFFFYTTVESKTAYVYEYKNSIKTPLKYLDSNVSISPPFHEYAGWTALYAYFRMQIKNAICFTANLFGSKFRN